jgi:hypothetical protein
LQCKLERENLTLSITNLTIITCCVYHELVWFAQMIWLTKNNTILQHQTHQMEMEMEDRQSPRGFLLLVVHHTRCWWDGDEHTDKFPTPKLKNHT